MNNMSNAIIIIPARYDSTRYPGKPLVHLRDRSGHSKTLIHRSWEAAMCVTGAAGINQVNQVFVATDDQRIADHVHGFGGQVLMTSPDCVNGTERCAEALSKLKSTSQPEIPEPEIIVNLQGDAPLTPPWFIEQLVAALKANPNTDLATPVLACDSAALQALLEDRKAGRVGGTTAVFNRYMEALYFSKEVIPYTDPGKIPETKVFHHVGIYAYRPAVLKAYPHWPVGQLEQLEGLEQLRFLENGRKVLCIPVEAHGRVFWELNNPEDVDRIERCL